MTWTWARLPPLLLNTGLRFEIFTCHRYLLFNSVNSCDAENNLRAVLTHLAQNKAPSPEGKEPTNTLDELRKPAQLEQESTERSQTENEARLQAEREKKTNEEEKSLNDNKRRTEQEAELALRRQRAAAKQSLVAVLADKMIGTAMLFQVQFRTKRTRAGNPAT
jgi:hypothetical protein